MKMANQTQYKKFEKILRRLGYEANFFCYDDDSLYLYSLLTIDNFSNVNKKNSTIDLKIAESPQCIISYAPLKDFSFLPKKSNQIEIKHCDFCANDISNVCFDVDTCDLFEFYDSAIEKITFGKGTYKTISIKYCNRLKTLIFDSNVNFEGYLLLTSLPYITTFDSKSFILPKHLNDINISTMSGITYFSENMDICANVLRLDDLVNLKSWRNIDKMKIKNSIRLPRMHTKNNIVNLMLLETKHVFCNDLRFSPYNLMSNRKEFIMDFVLSLLDDDLREEAEL